MLLLGTATHCQKANGPVSWYAVAGLDRAHMQPTTSAKAFVSATGVIPIDRLTDVRTPIAVVCQRIAQAELERVYGVRLPQPQEFGPEDNSRYVGRSCTFQLQHMPKHCACNHMNTATRKRKQQQPKQQANAYINRQRHKERAHISTSQILDTCSAHTGGNAESTCPGSWLFVQLLVCPDTMQPWT